MATVAATSLKVMNWNIQGGNSSDGDAHWDSIVSTIAAEDPDIVTLQEVHNDKGHLVDGRPGINQYQTLLDTFPAYEGHFARSDTNAYGGSAGQLILSKYPINEKVSYTLPNDSSGAVDRSMGGVNIGVGGTAVRVYSTHLSAGDGAAAVARREAQARYVLGKLPADKMSTPMLFTGDLNVRPDAAIRSWIAACRVARHLDTGQRQHRCRRGHSPGQRRRRADRLRLRLRRPRCVRGPHPHHDGLRPPAGGDPCDHPQPVRRQVRGRARGRGLAGGLGPRRGVLRRRRQAPGV